MHLIQRSNTGDNELLRHAHTPLRLAPPVVRTGTMDAGLLVWLM
jgi:hypothetical protein